MNILLCNPRFPFMGILQLWGHAPHRSRKRWRPLGHEGPQRHCTLFCLLTIIQHLRKIVLACSVTTCMQNLLTPQYEFTWSVETLTCLDYRSFHDGKIEKKNIYHKINILGSDWKRGWELSSLNWHKWNLFDITNIYFNRRIIDKSNTVDNATEENFSYFQY